MAGSLSCIFLLLGVQRLGLGGILASSGWIYWETLAILVGSALGPIPLSVHTIPTQVLSIVYMIPKGLGVALSVRMSALLAVNVKSAYKLVGWAATACVILFLAMSLVLYFVRDALFGLFTTKTEVLDGVQEIWAKVCLYLFITAIFGMNMGIATGLSMQWIQGGCLVFALWCIGLPTTYYFAVLRHGGLGAVWSCLWPPYLAIDVMMVAVFLLKDWREVALSIGQEESRQSLTVSSTAAMTVQESESFLSTERLSDDSRDSNEIGLSREIV